MKKKIKMAILIISAITLIVTISTIIAKSKDVDIENITNNALLLNGMQKMKEEVSTTEIPKMTSADEETLEYQEVESKEFELEGNKVYDNGGYNSVNVQLGEKIGLTYYSQIDSRWKNIMYSSRGDRSQTIGSSGCGPTSAAMVVTSIKGIITPSEMAELYVKYRI